MPNHWSGNLSAAERSNPSRSRLEAESRPLFFFQAGNGPTRGLLSGWTVRLARHCCLAIYLTGKRCGFARCIENKKVKSKQSNSTHLPSLKGLLQSIGEHFSLSPGSMGPGLTQSLAAWSFLFGLCWIQVSIHLRTRQLASSLLEFSATFSPSIA